MKRSLSWLLGVGMLFAAGASYGKIITVNTENNSDFSAGKTNLVTAINALADGDTIQFNIPGTGVHYIQTPADGYPLITISGVTIDGYTQPGASPNTNAIHAPNSAVLKIVLDSRNGNALSMQPAVEAFMGRTYNRLGYGADELAILGFFRATNATVKGLAILSAPKGTGSGYDGTIKSVSFCANSEEAGGGVCENWHVSGCWFGVDPATGQIVYLPDGVTVATPGIAISSYRTRNDSDPANVQYNYPGTVGVAKGSTNPRAEFNVIITGYGFDSEGMNFRISGNFWGVLPDGMTSIDMSVLNDGAQLDDGFVEIGRNVSNCVIGTDGDGVNDADEGNVFGGWANGGAVVINLYGSPQTNVVIAGNWFGVAIDGVTRFANTATILDGFTGQATAQFGSDFDGVSDALEANVVFNNNPFAILFPTPAGSKEPIFFAADAGAQVSFRGNELVNNNLVPFTYADGTGTLLTAFTNYCRNFMVVTNDAGDAVSVIPILDAANSVYPKLKGTFAKGLAPYTTIIVDVCQSDPEGWNNGKLFALMELTDLATYTNGFPQGKKYLASVVVPNTGILDMDVSGLATPFGQITITVNYSADPMGTHQGRVHTSNFSDPITFVPGCVDSVGLTHIVPDMLLWYSTNNYYTNGPLAVGGAVANLGIWDPYVSVLGDSTFLVENTTYANDGLQVNKRYAFAFQPAAGGVAKLGEAFYADDGTPFRGQIDYQRQSGNPGRVAADKRYGAVKFLVGGEASPGYVAAFQSDTRWTSNSIYANPWRYGSVQAYSLDPATLVQTPLCKAFDAINGRQTVEFVGNQGEVTRFGGDLAALDDGNFVVVVDDRSLYTSLGRAATMAIVRPDGSIVKDTVAVDPEVAVQIWSNLAAHRGGFCVRYNHTLYFFDNKGELRGSIDQSSSGIPFDTGRGDQTRIASDIRSHYVYLAGAAPYSGQPTHAPVMLAVWDANTMQFVTSATVSDTDPTLHGIDAVNLAVDALDRICVAYDFRPTPDFPLYQMAARVMAFDGQKITFLTHSFFPFVNHDPKGTIAGFTTQTPGVAMTTRQICISSKAQVNSTNNPAGGADTPGNTALYTVISHPAPVPAPEPPVTITPSGIISWPMDAGLFTLLTSPTLPASSWSTVTPQPATVQVGALYQMTVPVGTGSAYFRLAR